MKKTRLISIVRRIEVEVLENGKPEKKKVYRRFPCCVNAAVPFDHKMCE